MRMVSKEEWNLVELNDDDRRGRLLNPLSPENLLAAMVREAERSASDGLITLNWEEAIDPDAPPGFFRTAGQIPVTEATFDQLFNGRSGYRAQYYLSPEEGEIFNKAVVDRLGAAVEAAYAQKPLNVGLKIVQESLGGPYSKIWVFKDKKAFDEATPNTLNPRQWMQNNALRGRRVPLPSHLSVDLKGTFIKAGSEPWIDPIKLDRPFDLNRKGFV